MTNLNKNIKIYNTPNEIFDDLMSSNGVTSEESRRRFLNPSFSDLYDPFLMKNMDKAVERIKSAISNQERILIFGDYDCDGICSTTILTRYLRSKGLHVDTHLPTREEGYGLNVEAIEDLLQDCCPDLIITCDCGITAIKEVDEILSLGFDIIVTDHHEPSFDIPKCIVVDPKQSDCNYPFKDLCGAGVALKVVQAVEGNIDNIKKYFGLAMLATITDVVPLIDENRTISKLGLNIFNSKDNKALIGLQSGYKPIKYSDIGFKLGPKINSAGRIKDANIALELFLSDDESRIMEIAADLELLNEQRKEYSNNVFLEVKEQLSKYDLFNKNYIILKGNWEVGVIGIGSSRLLEEYSVLTILFTEDKNGVLSGSGRSPKNINIFDLFNYCKDLLLSYGGHKQAGGLTLKSENFDKFIAKVEEYLKDKDQVKKEPLYDYDITNIKIDDVFIDQLRSFEPFGLGNKEPVFNIKKNFLNDISFIKSQHLSFSSNNLKLTKFGALNQYNVVSQNLDKDILFKIDYNNTFNNKSAIITNIKLDNFDNYIAKEHKIEQICLGIKLNCKNNIVKYKDFAELSEIKGQKGILLVCSDTKSFNDNKPFIDKILGSGYDIDIEFNGQKYPESRVVINPSINYDYSLFNFVVILDEITKEQENFYSQFIPGKVYIKNAYSKIKGLVNRQKLGIIFLNLESNTNKHRTYNVYELYKLANNCTFDEFIIAIRVFEELNLISYEDDQFIINDIKVELDNSKIFNYFKE